MDRTNNFQHAWFNQTTLHPIGIAALVLLLLLVLLLPRRFAFLPLILASCFISDAQRIVLSGLDFTILRILVLVSIARILARNEQRGFRFQNIDWAVIAWTCVGSLAYVIREASMEALIYKVGKGVDFMGIYFVFRLYIRSWKDADRAVWCFCVVAVPLACAFLVEKHSGLNPFYLFGGIPKYTVVRMGKLRCQGPFPHAIMAGCFWVGLLPLIIPGWWRSRKDRFWVVVGTISAFVMIVTCTSSTPVLGIVFSVIAVGFFPVRRHLRPIRWAALFLAIAVHLSMKSGIWFLIARVDAVGGSTGYHRSFLIDQAIHRFSEWALIGTNSTGFWGFNLVDVTNQYVLEGVRGGFLSLVLFIVVLALSFQSVGRMIRYNRKNRARLYASWGLGAAMFTHCWMFLAVSYFGQIWVVWYMTLAMIAGLAPARSAKRTRTAVQHGSRKRLSPAPAT